MDFKAVFKHSPQNFNLSFNFTSTPGRTTPDASMQNQTLKSSEKVKKRIFLAYKKKLCLADDHLDRLYSQNMEEAMRLQGLKKMGMVYLLKLENFFGKKAVVIQKIAKGFITRRKYEGILIELHKKYTYGLVEDLKLHAKKTFYIGKVVLGAVVKVQSVIRTWNYLRKHGRDLLQSKQQLRRVRIHCRILANQCKLKQKREEFIKSRLETIRKNLIKLKIKQIIQRFAKSFKRNIRKSNKKTPKDSVFVNFSALLGNILKGETIKNEDKSESDYSDSEDGEGKGAVKGRNYRMGKRGSAMPCQVFSGIPVLIELKRKSQLWVERFDPQIKANVIDFKKDWLSINEARRRISVTRPDSGVGLDVKRMKKQRASFSYSTSAYIK